MSKYRICERQFYNEYSGEWMSYYFVQKKILFTFWFLIKSGFDSVDGAEHWINGNTRSTERVIKEINC